MVKSVSKAPILRRLLRSVWLFPVIVILAVLVLTAFRVSGSSVGIYNQLYYGSGSHDSHLIYGTPRKVRSDEWLVATAMTVAQSHHGFPATNQAIGRGLDMSVIFDVPYDEWSEIFHPQNLPFFVVPLEYAFAMKWWLLGGALAIGAYFFVLALLPRRRLLASLLGLAMLLTPFVQWWYQTITVFPLAYALLLVALFAASLRASSADKRVLLGAGMAYLFACFMLLLYPPFQIPCAIVAGVVGLGLWLEQKKAKAPWREAFKLLLPTAVGLLVALTCVAAFWLQHKMTIKLIENSVYPGNRAVAGGGFGLIHLLDGLFDNRLQFEAANQHYQTNQSEASNFVMLWPFLLVPSWLLALRRWQKDQVIEWAPLLVGVVLLVFSADLFLPVPDLLLKLTGLSVVPHSRLLIGFGLANLALLVLLLRQLSATRLGSRSALIFAALGGVLLGADGLLLHQRHPWLIPSVETVAVLAVAAGVIVWLLLKGRGVAAASLLLLIGAYSVYRVNPLYTGLSPLTDSGAIQAIQHSGGGTWVALDQFYDVNLPAAAGVSTLSATYSYPQLALWRTNDSNGSLIDVYNRYGSAIFTERPTSGAFQYSSPDQFFVHYDPCGGGLSSQVTQVLAEQPVSSPCLSLERSVVYPELTYFIYRVEPLR